MSLSLYHANLSVSSQYDQKMPFESHKIFKMYQSLQESLFAMHCQKQFNCSGTSNNYDVSTKQFCCVVYDRKWHVLL